MRCRTSATRCRTAAQQSDRSCPLCAQGDVLELPAGLQARVRRPHLRRHRERAELRAGLPRCVRRLLLRPVARRDGADVPLRLRAPMRRRLLRVSASPGGASSRAVVPAASLCRAQGAALSPCRASPAHRSYRRGETAAVCQADCPVVCGDGICNRFRCVPQSSLALLLQSTCGDSRSCSGATKPSRRNLCRTPAENANNCPQDCAAKCGDGLCSINSGENSMSCPQDCPVVCGDRCGCGCFFAPSVAQPLTPPSPSTSTFAPTWRAGSATRSTASCAPARATAASACRRRASTRRRRRARRASARRARRPAASTPRPTRRRRPFPPAPCSRAPPCASPGGGGSGRPRALSQGWPRWTRCSRPRSTSSTGCCWRTPCCSPPAATAREWSSVSGRMRRTEVHRRISVLRAAFDGVLPRCACAAATTTRTQSPARKTACPCAATGSATSTGMRRRSRAPWTARGRCAATACAEVRDAAAQGAPSLQPQACLAHTQTRARSSLRVARAHPQSPRRSTRAPRTAVPSRSAATRSARCTRARTA